MPKSDFKSYNVDYMYCTIRNLIRKNTVKWTTVNFYTGKEAATQKTIMCVKNGDAAVLRV